MYRNYVINPLKMTVANMQQTLCVMQSAKTMFRYPLKKVIFNKIIIIISLFIYFA